MVITLTLVAVVVVVIQTTQCVTPPVTEFDEFDEHVDEHVEAAVDEEWVSATFAEAHGHLMRGHQRSSRVDLETAQNLFEAILEKVDTHVPSLYSLGDIALRLGDSQRAAKLGVQIVQLEPDNIHAYRLYAYASLPSPDKVFALSRVLELSQAPDPNAMYDLASTLLSLGDVEKAVEGFRAVFQDHPDILMAKFSEALALLASGEPEEAADALHELLAVDAHHPYAHALLYLIHVAHPDATDSLGLPPFSARVHNVDQADLDAYTGFVPAPDSGWTPEVVAVESSAQMKAVLDAKRASRTPVIFRLPHKDYSVLGWDSELVNSLSVESVADALGNHTVLVQTSALGDAVSGVASIMGAMPVVDYVRLVKSPPSDDGGQTFFYLNVQQAGHAQDVYSPILAPFKDQIPLPASVLGEETAAAIKIANTWVAASQVPDAVFNSTLHNDERDNLYALVQGKKNFRVFPPPSGLNLYPLGTLSGFDKETGRFSYVRPTPTIDPLFPHFAAVYNPWDIDVDHFVKAAGVKDHAVDFEVLPGDVLYLPAGWWHAVGSVGGVGGESIAVNFWWDP